MSALTDKADVSLGGVTFLMEKQGIISDKRGVISEGKTGRRF